MRRVAAAFAQKQLRWQFGGTVVPGYPKLNPLDADFWEPFGNFIGRCGIMMPGTSRDHRSDCQAELAGAEV